MKKLGQLPAPELIHKFQLPNLKNGGEVPDVEQGASPAATFQVSRYVASSAALETFGRA